MPAHLHFDCLGGIAGDMTAAALFDLGVGELVGGASGLLPLLRSAGVADDVDVEVVEHRDGVLRGRRFVVRDPREAAPHRGPGTFVFRASHARHAQHEHVPYQGIAARIAASALTAGAKARAADILRRLAVAEGGVHGIDDLADVAFHEVGAQDSVCDVVTAAVLLDALDVAHGGLTASTSSLPLGSGRVRTAHGELPVPAPATLALLVGLAVHDDGRPGERVTPTGAAILRHVLGTKDRRPPGTVAAVGTGFGTKVLPGLSNVVRVTLQTSTTAGATERDVVRMLSCELDDMTGEELAYAADTLRAAPGVRDVTLTSISMKKGRAGALLQLVCDVDAERAVADAVFAHTSTLGLRTELVERHVLPRTASDVGGVAVKTAVRPAAEVTMKVEHDALPPGSLAARRRIRRRVEGGGDG